MKEKIIEAVGNRLDKLEVWIDDVRLNPRRNRRNIRNRIR